MSSIVVTPGLNDPELLAKERRILTEIRAKGLPMDLGKGLLKFTSHVINSPAHDQRLENVSEENLAKRVHTLFMFDEHGRMHPEITDFNPERQAAMGPREEKSMNTGKNWTF